MTEELFVKELVSEYTILLSKQYSNTFYNKNKSKKEMNEETNNK